MASNDFFDPDAEDPEDDDLGIKASHKYTGIISVIEALGVEEFQEELEYKTWCYCLPTSWEIIIRMEKQIPFHNFNMFVTLRRIDLTDIVVKGILLIWFLNTHGKKCPVPYRLECLVDGRGVRYDVSAVDEHFRCLLREDDYMTFPDDVLVVKVQLFVENCCPVEDKTTSNKLTEMFCCPKL